jgi:hypothetical protein
MTNPIPTVPLKELQDELSDELIATLSVSVASPETEQTLKIFLVSELQTIRFNMLVDLLAITDLWAKIRENEAVTDLINDATSVLRLHAATYGKEIWSMLCTHVSTAMGVFNDAAIDHSLSAIVASRELERYVALAQAQKFVAANPWLVTLFLLKQNPTVRKLCEEMALVATKRARANDERSST